MKSGDMSLRTMDNWKEFQDIEREMKKHHLLGIIAVFDDDPCGRLISLPQLVLVAVKNGIQVGAENIEDLTPEEFAKAETRIEEIATAFRRELELYDA